MQKIIEDRGEVLAVRAKAEDAVAWVKRHRSVIRERLAKGQPPLPTNAERDMLQIAIAQTLGIL
jgi:hypothetical protein